ncbi:alpha/beta hydrolase [Halobacteriales archaeon QS_1_68_20]|nr:MAG: alpha/beta hydrolase [Halobacteriales archaeon QS_1_68_20]
MNSEEVVVPGARDVRGTLDAPSTGTNRVVVACPPHPQFGGNRRDRNLRALGEALTERDVACLRFDYGEWDEGRGERTDVHNALRYAAERYDHVGPFGYSFGAVSALLVAADPGRGESRGDAATTAGDGNVDLAAVSALAPTAKATDALADVACPLQILYGTRDDTVEWEPVVERARELAADDRPVEVVKLSADHHFVGQERKVAARTSEFLAGHLD